MDRIYKIGLLSLEWNWGLLTLNISPIFFKNNVMKKTKIGLTKSIWTAAAFFSQSNAYMTLRIRDSREANI